VQNVKLVSNHVSSSETYKVITTNQLQACCNFIAVKRMTSNYKFTY